MKINMKGLLKRTAGTGRSFWTVTFVHGTDHLSDNSIFVRDMQDLKQGSSSIEVCDEDAEKLTNDDYNTAVDFEIVERQIGSSTFPLAKIKSK